MTARMISHSFHLRKDLVVTLDLPSDLTMVDAERLSRFLRALPLPEDAGQGHDTSEAKSESEMMETAPKGRHKSNLSDEMFETHAPGIVDFLLETMTLPKVAWTTDLLAEELDMQPSTMQRILRRLANDGGVVAVEDDFVSIPNKDVTVAWLAQHPVNRFKVKPLDAYTTTQAAKLIRILLSEPVMLTGKVVSSIAADLGMGRNAIERLVRQLVVSHPFVIKPAGLGSSVKIRPTHFGQAREWLAEAESIPTEQTISENVGGVSDATYTVKAPLIVRELLGGTDERPKTTADLMKVSDTRHQSLRAILKRLQDQDHIPLSISIACRGQAPQVRILDVDAAKLWLDQRSNSKVEPMGVEA